MRHLLPKHLHPKLTKCRIGSDKVHILDNRLRGEHPIERVAMIAGRRACEMRVLEVRQIGEVALAVMSHSLERTRGNLSRLGPFSGSHLCRNFPGHHSTHKYRDLRRSCDRLRGVSVVEHPPLQTVRNEMKVWLSRRILILSLPKSQLVFGQRIEEKGVGYGHFPLHAAGFAPDASSVRSGASRTTGSLPRAMHDLLARFRPRDQLRQLRFGLVDCDR